MDIYTHTQILRSEVALEYITPTRFNDEASFSEALFNKNVSFREAQINNSVDFSNSYFLEAADFCKSCFRGEIANFEGAKFKGPINFWETIFNINSINFGWCQFFDYAKFWRTQFNGQLTFQGSQFQESADFTLAQFNGATDFLGTEFDQELYFTDVSFEKLEIAWPSIKDRLICDGPIYLMLIRNFKNMEQFEYADGCYCQYRDWRRDDRPFGWLKFFDYLAWLSCGYGVIWQNTIISAITTALTFGLYYEVRRNGRNITYHLLGSKRSDSSGYESKFELKRSLSFSAFTLLSLPSDWYLLGKDDYANLIRVHIYSAILERMIGWGLMLLLIGTLTRLMVRY
jgi:hypothetical protein